MNIVVQVDTEAIDLSTPVGEYQIQVGEDDWVREPRTLGDAVAARIAEAVQRDDGYRTLKQRVLDVREAEIRDQVKVVVADAIAGSVQPTNTFGQPTGTPVGLVDVIVKEAREVLNKRADYGRGKTLLEQVIAAEVEKALRKELAEAIEAEKAKVVAAVRARAADLIAQAVKEGIGR